MHVFFCSFIAVEPIDTYCVLISSKVVYFLKPGEFADRDTIFLEVKYDDLYHCLVSKDHGKVYVQLTKKAESTSSGVAIPGPSHQKPMVRDVSLHVLYVIRVIVIAKKKKFSVLFFSKFNCFRFNFSGFRFNGQIKLH